MQDALLHLQCTLPPERVDTFTVNGILIAATRSKQPQLLVLHQCLDILQERGLAWNATTWRQVFRLQAGSFSYLVMIGLLYKAYPNGCQQVLLRLRPYPVRGQWLLYSRHDCITPSQLIYF